jgi:uncharacterized Zn finger protein
MQAKIGFAAQLLGGEVPPDLEEVFASTGVTLFPATWSDLRSTCTCPDWENPCKHIAAVYFLLAEAFDDDPFLIFAWRGRNKETLLGNLRSRRRGVRSDEPTIDETDADDPTTGPFGWPVADPETRIARSSTDTTSIWGRDADLTSIEIRPRLAVAPDLILRQLDPAPLGSEADAINDALRPMYVAMTSGAAAMALGEPESEPEKSKARRPTKK